MTGSVFPAFLKLEYQPSGSAKSSFLAEMASISTDAKRQFENAFGEIGKTITNSLSGFKGSNFKFDLNTSGLRQAAADADFALQKLQELQRAVSARMPSTNDPLYAETVKYAQALSAQVIEAQKAKEVADAQVRSYSVLQAEIDKTAASNARLADSYRATFIEQAKAANAAFAYQQRLNSSLGLTRTSESGFGFTPGKSARDSASVFESQSYAPKADARSGLDRLLAGQASIDKAALSGATLENVLGRVSARGQEVAAALQQAERAAEALAATRLAENEAALARAAAEAKSYAAAAAQLRAQLDPTIAIQQRFDAELANADRLLAANAISQREYAQAVALAQNNLKQSWASLTSSQEENIRVTKRGTSETGNVINGIRSQRVAFTQLGQQMQDVVVQTQMGTSATVIFTQQVPQMAFALSGLAESTNKTYARIGQFASFLAGPWGAAVFAATAILGPLAIGLLSAGDEAENSKSKVFDFSKSLDVMTLSAERGSDAMKQLADATRGAIAVQGDFLANQAAIAAASAASLQAELALEQRKLATAKSNRFSLVPTDGDNTITREVRIRSLEANIPNLQASLAAAKQAEVNAQIAASQRKVNESRDAGTAATNRYNEAVGALNKRFEASQSDPLSAATNPGFIDRAGYEREFGKLTDQFRTAQEAAREAKRKSRSKGKSEEERAAEKAAREAEKLSRFGDKTAESIQRINERFNEQPLLIDQAAQAARELDATIADLEKRKPAGFQQMIAEAETAKGVIEQALVRPFERLREESEQRVQLQNLISQGRDAEAAALQDIFRLEQTLGTLTEDRRREVLGITEAEQRHIEALQRVQQMQSAYLDATRSIRSEVEAILGGYGKISNLKGIFQQLQGRVLTEQIFGDVFRDMDLWVKEKTDIGSSVDMMAQEVDRAGDAAGTFADRLVEATNTLAGAVSSSALGVASARGVESSWALGNLSAPKLLTAPQDAANDNQGIVVVANKPARQTVNDLTPEQYFERMSARLTRPVIDALSDVLGPSLGKTLGAPITGALEGYLTTGTGFGAVLGGLKDIKGLPASLSKGLSGAFKGAQTGGMVSGIGNALGLGLSNTGSQIGGAIGSFIPIPGGDIIGSVVGGLIGKLFGNTVKSGYAQVRNGGVAGTYGRTGELQNDAAQAANSLVETIASMAETLGVTLGNYDFDVGKKNDKFVVNTGARGVFNFDTEAEAFAFAVREAVADGAFDGLSDGAKRLLQNSGDLQKQVQKAVDYQNVFKELKQIKDPVGAALDDLNADFSKLKATFAEAGAGAAELATLEELYGIRRAAAIKDANNQILGSLNDLIKSLTVGNENRSLREREAEALKVFTPLETRVKAGDTTAFSDFSQAAQDLLDIQRQLYGSQSQFFASEDAIKSVTQTAIDRAQQVSDAAANRDSPFKSGSAAAVNDNASVTSAIDRQTQAQRDIFNAVNDNLGTLVRQNRELAIAMQKSMANGTLRDNRGNF